MTFDTKLFAARVENLSVVNAFVEECADRFDLDAKKKFGLLLALEEAFVNICSHAYPDGEGAAEVFCEYGGAAFVLEISDTGSSFDVLSLPDPDTTSEIMDRQIGGLGVHFIRKFSDRASYRRENEHNILRMEFNRTLVGGNP